MTMSEQDEALLDDDLGDEDYNLGNEEEEALLAEDDNDHKKFFVNKQEEESDDVLDLGVTDGFEDLVADDDNIIVKNRKLQKEHVVNNEDNISRKCLSKESAKSKLKKQLKDSNINQLEVISAPVSSKLSNIKDAAALEQKALSESKSKGDLREKLNGKSRDNKESVNKSHFINYKDGRKFSSRRNNLQNQRNVLLTKTNHEMKNCRENIFLQYRKSELGTFSEDKTECDPDIFLQRESKITKNSGELGHDVHSTLGFHHGFNSFHPTSAPNSVHLVSENKHAPLLPVQSHNVLYPAFNNATLPPTYHVSGINGMPIPVMPNFVDSRQQMMANQYSEIIMPQHATELSREFFNDRNDQNCAEFMFDNAQYPPLTPFTTLNESQVLDSSNQRSITYDMALRKTSVTPETPFINQQYAISSSLCYSQLPQQHQRPPSIGDACVIPSNASTGHKILINPHFKAKQSSPLSPNSAGKFVQAVRITSNSNIHDGSSTIKQNKNDDPFSYFSDVWQENKSHRLISSTSRRLYSPENKYKKCSSNKFDNESQRSHRDKHSEENPVLSNTFRDRSVSPVTKKEEEAVTLPSTKRESTTHQNTGNIINETIENKISSYNSYKDLQGKLKNRIPGKDENISCGNLKNSPIQKKNLPVINKKFEQNAKKKETEDPEMQEYQKKLEEQKKLREKVIQEKENRRKLAAMEKHKADSNENNAESSRHQSILPFIVKEISIEKIDKKDVKRKDEIAYSPSTEEESAHMRIIHHLKSPKRKEHLAKLLRDHEVAETSSLFKKIEKTHHNSYGKKENNLNEEIDLVHECDIIFDQDKDNNMMGDNESLSRVAINKMKKDLIDRNSSLMKKPESSPRRQLGQIRQLLTNSQRIVVKGNINAEKNHSLTNVVKRPHGLAHQLQTKKCVKSNIVKVEHLPTNITENQIRKMCQGIGSIETVQTNDGSAIIKFKTQSAATVFHKKYHDKIVNSSRIKIQLMRQIVDQKVSKNG